jgi:phenylpropionate dioxygenase-like ring-hydroxylating dioxygenase large terminal subunit
MIHERVPAPADSTDGLDATRVVDNRVYYDPLTYQRESDRIFARCWQLVCHESEIAAPGAFMTTVIADSPIIVVRGKDDVLRAFFNTCRHRGALVMADACGQANALRCPYHFWVYSLEGELIGVPGEEAYANSGFEKERFPLVPLHCEVKLGLVFVNPDPGPVDSLDAWLGRDVIATLSRPLADATYDVAKVRHAELPVNWKIWAENARDGYHVPFVHPFFRRASPPGSYRLAVNGHAIQELGMSKDGMDPQLWDDLQRDRLPGLAENDGYIVTLFPDATIMVRSNFISIDLQHVHGVKSLTFEERLLAITGDSDEVRDRRALGQAAWLWDPLKTEDFPIFETQQRGVETRGTRYSVIARGADALTGARGDDNRLRHFWTQWRAMMGEERNGVTA